MRLLICFSMLLGLFFLTLASATTPMAAVPRDLNQAASQTSISNARVFAYAEANYPSFFAGTPTAGQYQQYNYQYYPTSGNYLAVDTSGVIFGLGPYTGNVVTSFGPVTAYSDAIIAWEATQAGTSASITPLGLGDSIKVTNAASITVSGVADATNGVSQVTYFNQLTNQDGTATGTEEWSATIALAEGDNPITFTVHSASGSSASTNAIITYYPDLAFSTSLSLSKEVAYIGESSDITAEIGIDFNAISSTSAVKLFESQNNGAIIAEVGAMSDDGILPDEIQTDGIFTRQFSLTPTSSSNACYRVKVETTTGSSYYSENKCIWQTNHFAAADVNSAVDTADNAETLYTQQLNQGNSQVQAAQAVADSLANSPSIAIAEATDEGGVWWISNAGIIGLYHPELAGQKSGGYSERGVTSSTPVIKAKYHATHYPTTYLENRARYQPSQNNSVPQQRSLLLAAPVAQDPNEIRSTKGILISPYLWQFTTTDDYYGPWATIKSNNSCKLSAAKEILNNTSGATVTLDSFKNLSDYGYIHFSTHGDNYFAGLLNLWDSAWGPNDWLKGSLSQVVILTNVKLPKNGDGSYNITGYEDDINNKYVAITNSGTLALLPAFFKTYLDSLPNSLVVLGACRSMYNNSMANAFLTKGAGAVLGYSDYVNSSYARNTSNKIIEELFSNKTVKQGFDAAVTAYGASDADADPAFFKMVGNDNLKLGGSLQNGSFEDGALTPWSKFGDGRVITQLGGSLPTDGSWMGIISTGLGYTVESGSVSQNFCASPTTSTVTFDWRFYSEEFLEYCNSVYQDTFTVSICEVDPATDVESNCSTLLSKTVDSLCGSVSQSDVSFDQGGVYDTGWQNDSATISSYANKPTKLKFSASDVGDSIYDTAILIDNIVINEQ